jgi:AcrR family transcriptional regulator
MKMTPRHKKSQRKEAMQKTRRLLLEAAAEEFAQYGFQGANVNRIADAAGFSVGTVYNYFPSKREFMLTFINEIGQMHVDFIKEQVNQAADPHLRLRNFFKAGFEFVQTNLKETRSIFNALNGPDEEFRQQLFTTYAPLFELLSEDIINPGIKQGDFRTDIPTTTSGLIMLIYLGAGSQFSPEGKHWIDNQTVADFVLHALQIHNSPKNNQDV